MTDRDTADGNRNPEDALTIAGHEDRDGPGDLPDDLGGSPKTNGDGAANGDGLPGNEGPAADAGENGEDDGEVEPVELLVQLAENGEIEPWDIEIVSVTDAFLDHLDDGDLRNSGRALFYASVLLRMKSDEMLSDDDEDEEELPPWERPFADEGGDGEAAPGAQGDPVAHLETEMERRLERKQARGTPETLDELVRDLREAERGSWWKESREYDTSDSPSGYQRGTQELNYHRDDGVRVDEEPTEDDVTGTTHGEDIEETIADVRSVLSDHYDAGRREVLYAEVETAGGSRVGTYLALLFLAHRGTVRLRQDELFGDLWIQDPDAEFGPEEAIAD